MPGNSFGEAFRVTTFGESHGVALGCIVDGCPPGLELEATDMQFDLDRRKPGTSKFATQRKEGDQVKILSGVFEGVTTGTSIGLLIENENQKSKDYSEIKDLYRPAHADYTYNQKYGVRDYRGGGRASARETAMRVAAGAIAKKYLKQRHGIEVRGYLSQMGDIEIDLVDWDVVNQNPFFCPDVTKIPALEEMIDSLRREGNSIGAKVTVVASGLMPGLGEPVFDKLDADLAHGLMGINAVKGVEIGGGFALSGIDGSLASDEMRAGNSLETPTFLSNQAGGVLGGISTGQQIVVRVAIKPTSSILTPRQSIDRNNQNVDVVTKGRHDPCVGIRGVPVAEAMMSLVLADLLMRHKAQCGFDLS